MRQVNNWGFDRVHFGPDENAYYNEYFLRGLPHIAAMMHRQPNGKLQQRMQSVYSQIRFTPDFHEMSKRHPLPDIDGQFPPSRGAIDLSSITSQYSSSNDERFKLSHRGGSE
eukprot:4250217-Ditylum_brightwellii.AAC.1